MSADVLSVLRCGQGFRATKVIADRRIVEDYNCGAFFSVEEMALAGFDDMAAALDRISRDARKFVVRGAPLPGINRNRHMRRYREKHGDTRSYEPCARRWLGIDSDHVEPAGLDFATDPEEGVEQIIRLLPAPFADASCWWQATSSAGCKRNIRARLFFWLSRPIEDAECKGWLPGDPVVDTSLYQPVGIHYTAPPIIRSGRDPMARRQGIREGLTDTVQVPVTLPHVSTLDVPPINVPLRPLDDAGGRVLARTLQQSRQALDIWSGRKVYADRSTRHYAFLCAIIRAGILDDMENIELLPGAMLALDEQVGADPGKALRPDYQAITIGAALAAVTAEARP
jgi:hypothetical protein